MSLKSRFIVYIIYIIVRGGSWIYDIVICVNLSYFVIHSLFYYILSFFVLLLPYRPLKVYITEYIFCYLFLFSVAGRSVPVTYLAVSHDLSSSTTWFPLSREKPDSSKLKANTSRFRRIDFRLLTRKMFDSTFFGCPTTSTYRVTRLRISRYTHNVIPCNAVTTF